MVRLGGFLKSIWKLMALSLLFVLIMAGLDLIIPYLTKEAIDPLYRRCGKGSCLKRRWLAGGAPLLESIWRENHPRKRKREISSPARDATIHGWERDGPFPEIWPPDRNPILPVRPADTGRGKPPEKISLLV